MKTLVEVKDGIESFLGKRVLVMCEAYFYDGKLVGVNDTCVKLEDTLFVFETGAWADKGYKSSQKLPAPIYIQTAKIEAFMEGKAGAYAS